MKKPTLKQQIEAVEIERVIIYLSFMNPASKKLRFENPEDRQQYESLKAAANTLKGLRDIL